MITWHVQKNAPLRFLIPVSLWWIIPVNIINYNYGLFYKARFLYKVFLQHNWS